MTLIHISIAKLYRFQGWKFEVNTQGMPWPVCANGELKQRAGKKFYAMYEQFEKLTDQEKKHLQISG